ncbi:DEAD/DEAH box helicase family protein [Candidatus Pacearchaeota archaeon]|nr:DEAD/DEAH box helicase family protein [Candidatus Pacearchaeota archaeon]
MNRLLFDEKGRFVGIKNNNSVNKELYTRTEGNLMTSKELTFLNKESPLHRASQITDTPYWSFYSDGKKTAPLKYSNGKTQEDVVKEVIDLIHQGNKIILIHGVCGTGKSAIALNIARLLGRASIVVPFKNLQKQYEEDYTKKKYVVKPNGMKMKIAVITGRDNHDSIICPGVSCADPFLPDTILITEKNRDKILRYYNKNPMIQNKLSFPDIRRLKRISIAPSNPYWSPIRPAEFELTQLSDAKKKYYKGVAGDYIFYHRKEGCSYYDQFQAYLDADTIIFNAAKYEIEMAIGRKPEAEVDIIDEADSFLDNFSKDDSFSITRFASSLQNISLEYPESQELDKINELINLELKNKTALGVDEHQIFPVKDTISGKVLKLLLENKAIQAEISLDEEHYANKVLETALMFSDLFDDTYATYSKEDKDLYIHLVTTNVAKRFVELCEKTKTLVLMSGTLHSEDVLKNVFGIKDFVIVEAETKMPGRIDIIESSYELDCSYENIKDKRKEYLLALSACMEKTKRPVLIHVNAFSDLPTEQELIDYSITNIISREKLKNFQTEDKNGEIVSRFKAKLIDTLFTTKCSRGVDFPGDVCNSIVFTKYPNPNTQDIFWKILKMTHPGYFWSIYKDKASREFLQRLYRALRSNDDHVYVLSPDSRVINALKKMQSQG